MRRIFASFLLAAGLSACGGVVSNNCVAMTCTNGGKAYTICSENDSPSARRTYNYGSSSDHCTCGSDCTGCESQLMYYCVQP
jgi:hypothetical protein